jgi:hypothetical protein
VASMHGWRCRRCSEPNVKRGENRRDRDEREEKVNRATKFSPMQREQSRGGPPMRLARRKTPFRVPHDRTNRTAIRE